MARVCRAVSIELLKCSHVHTELVSHEHGTCEAKLPSIKCTKIRSEWLYYFCPYDIKSLYTSP